MCDHIFRTVIKVSYRYDKSTSTNLLFVSNFICEQLDPGRQVDAIYAHFSKAFVRLDHTILLYKLYVMGLSPSLLVHVFLLIRKQYVEYRGFNSFSYNVISGVT